MIKSFILGLFSEKLIVMLLPMALIIPQSANAGVFSFMIHLFGNKEINTASVYNSQNIALLGAALNPDPNPAKGGGDITIVGGTALFAEAGPSGTAADIEEGNTNGTISVYVVRSGDSLSQIAKMFGVTVNTIMWANDVRGSVIHEGQILVILPVSGVKHIVNKGETVQSITNKYKADLREVLDYNNLSKDSILAVGDVVIIPDGEIDAPKVDNTAVKRVVRGSSGPSYAGYYINPVSGGGKKTQGLHGFNAIDIGAPAGTPILAAATGDVIISKDYGWNGGYGTYIVIAHGNGTQTLYAHNTRNIVSRGMHVVKGQVIGYVGSTGKSTGPHLHFEIRGAKNPF